MWKWRRLMGLYGLQFVSWLLFNLGQKVNKLCTAESNVKLIEIYVRPILLRCLLFRGGDFKLTKIT